VTIVLNERNHSTFIGRTVKDEKKERHRDRSFNHTDCQASVQDEVYRLAVKRPNDRIRVVVRLVQRAIR
jgi:hypothetical protein